MRERIYLRGLEHGYTDEARLEDLIRVTIRSVPFLGGVFYLCGKIDELRTCVCGFKLFRTLEN